MCLRTAQRLPVVILLRLCCRARADAGASVETALTRGGKALTRAERTRMLVAQKQLRLLERQQALRSSLIATQARSPDFTIQGCFAGVIVTLCATLVRHVQTLPG